MDNELSDPIAGIPALPAPPAPEPPSRYNFDKPTQRVTDLLAVQLAECVRVVRTLSDQAIDPHLRDYERTPTIHALGSMIESSGKLAERIERIESGNLPSNDPPARRKLRES